MYFTNHDNCHNYTIDGYSFTKMTEIKFFDLIRGAFTVEPIHDRPVTYIPHDAPINDMANANPTPK